MQDIFDRGIVSEILPSKAAFFERLLSKERLRIYLGADPTAKDLHLSHAKNFMLLEEMRLLGHETIILIGDFTASIGDPSGKAAVRSPLAAHQIRENVRAWMTQIRPLMNFRDRENPPRIVYNRRWLSRLLLRDLLSLGAHFTVQQMLERDMFAHRLKKNTPVYLHEFLYPILQGYDSVVLDVDVELCGTDQIFNALVGRTMMRKLKNKEKYIIAVNLMENPKTGELMSKSEGKGVFLSSPPHEMYGAIMAQPDEMIDVLFLNCTRLPLSERNRIKAQGPRDAKARVAFEIVKIIYGEKNARLSEKEFSRTFQEGGLPKNIPELYIKKGDALTEKLVASGLVSSRGDWRRLVRGGAVRDEKGKKITDPFFIPHTSVVWKIGKRRFVRIRRRDA